MQGKGQAFFKFRGGAAGKGDGKHGFRCDPLVNEVGDAPYESVGFACAGACQHQGGFSPGGAGL